VECVYARRDDDLLLAEHGKEVVAGSALFQLQRKGVHEFEAWTGEKRNLAPNHFIIWEAIRLFQEKGYQILTSDVPRFRMSRLVFSRNDGAPSIVDLPTFLYPAA